MAIVFIATLGPHWFPCSVLENMFYPELHCAALHTKTSQDATASSTGSLSLNFMPQTLPDNVSLTQHKHPVAGWWELGSKQGKVDGDKGTVGGLAQ